MFGRELLLLLRFDYMIEPKAVAFESTLECRTFILAEVCRVSFLKDLVRGWREQMLYEAVHGYPSVACGLRSCSIEGLHDEKGCNQLPALPMIDAIYIDMVCQVADWTCIAFLYKLIGRLC